MEEVDIRVNGMGVGKVWLDPAETRGEGGEHDPRLVIPINFTLHQQPLEHQIVIIRLSASLHITQSPSHSDQFASRISYDTIYNMPMRSVTNGPSTSGFDLCFNLTHAQLKALEIMRHESGKNLYLCLEPIIAWNKHTGNSQGLIGGVSTLGEHGWDVNFGMFSDFAFFWLPAVGTLRLNLAAMDWVEKIFPGMGYDTFRLVEVKLPVSDDRLIPKDAIEHFKEALQDYDKGLYRECLMKCRLVHEAIEKGFERRLSIRLGRDHELGGAVTAELGWTTGSEQETFLNGAWKPLYVMANVSAHTPSTKSLLPTDAHVVLILTAALLEYLAQVE